MGVCKTCPFVAGPNAYMYDEDAIEALDAGYVPSCHQKVGTEQIFVDGGEPCEGFEAWCDGKRGFRKPLTVPKET